jgi:hypothetical protein
MRLLRSILPLAIALLAGESIAQARDLGGMSGAEIAALQRRLADGGCYRGAIDGQASPALQAAVKACPSQDPILRIETGMHVAAILDVAADAACHVLATGSLDKTVRLWSMPKGRLLRTQRVPLEDGPNGFIYGVAVSPDGSLAAAGGIDAHLTADKKGSIYVFDVATGTSVKRFESTGPIDSLAFSPDGRRLAVLQGANGLRVFDVESARVKTDPAYGDGQGKIAFAADGTLFAIHSDGMLRRYDANLSRTASVKIPGGRVPLSIAVRPQGDRIAVTYNDAKVLDILDATSLRRLGNADLSGIDIGGLSVLAWTHDGQRLLAGGTHVTQIAGTYRRMVRMFDADGRRVGADLAVSGNTINALAPCGDAIAFGTSDPEFGLISPDGGITLAVANDKVDMRGKWADAFTFSPDGKQVRFGLGIGRNDPAVVDLSAGTLANSLAPIPGFVGPDVTSIDVTNWRSSVQPLLHGRPFVNIPDITQQSFSLAVRGDRTGFVLGMQNYLVAFDAQGKERWHQGISAAYGVNLAANGNVVTSAVGDGTIRWYRWSDGKELLALFVNSATKVWVAWTPSGYYMASPGGEDLIGWQVNRGWSQAADFFPASRFRQRFNRPDIVQLALETFDEDAAIKQANEITRRRQDTRQLIEHLPPIIRISGPANGMHVQNATVMLNYAMRSPSGQPIERIDVLLNGRPVKAVGLPIQAVATDTEIQGSVDVTLTQKVTEVGLIAWTGGLASEAVSVKLAWDAAPEATRKLVALVVGVSNYADPAMKLNYAAKDARDFDAALKGQKGRYYVDVETRILTDRDVTRASVIEGLQWLEQSATNPNDVSVLFFAGHGSTDEKQTYWFYTSDASNRDVRIKGISQDETRKTLQNLQGKVLWFLDTCHAGDAAKLPPVDVNIFVNTVTSPENGGIVVFASSTGRQLSAESSDWGNGAFTKAIIEGIQLGKADLLGDGFITTSSLDTFVEHRVRALTDDKQNPVMGRPPDEPDFAIAQVAKR